MAERRMFHTAVVESDAFLDLPVGAQALYFHLAMLADDDGFVNGPKQIARKLRRPPKELRQLEESGFLLEFDGIVVIKHWLVANSLKKDRLHPVRYPEIAKEIYITKNRLYSKENQEESENLLEQRNAILDSKWNPKVRKGKTREGKTSEGKTSEDNFIGVPPGADGPAVPATYDDTDFLRNVVGKGVLLLSAEQVHSLRRVMGEVELNCLVSQLAKDVLAGGCVEDAYNEILMRFRKERSVK